ncbi:MAG: hypothetical protein U0359_23990 [Byssovorax sp.]
MVPRSLPLFPGAALLLIGLAACSANPTPKPLPDGPPPEYEPPRAFDLGGRSAAPAPGKPAAPAPSATPTAAPAAPPAAPPG